MEVHSTLKPGLDEKTYENALKHELQLNGLIVDSQKQYPVQYKGHQVGKLIPDLIVNSKVIVETKVITEFTAVHLAQVISYLNITNQQVGLLLNFKHNSLQHKRVSTSLSPPPKLQ